MRKTPLLNVKSPLERAALLLLGAAVETSVVLLGEPATERVLFDFLGFPPKLPGETHAAWRLRTGS